MRIPLARWAALPAVVTIAAVVSGIGTAAEAGGGMVVGGPLDGSVLPGDEGGMVIGGPANGSVLPPAE